MKPLACFLFIVVFILVTTYLLSLVLVHVFSEKIKEAKPHSVVVHLHNKKGKNRYLITNNSENKTVSNGHVQPVEGFIGKRKCTSCNSGLVKENFKQIVKSPKKKVKADNIDKRPSISNKLPKKTKNKEKIKLSGNKDKDVDQIETFTGDYYLRKYQKKYHKNAKKFGPTLDNNNAYNNCQYY